MVEKRRKPGQGGSGVGLPGAVAALLYYRVTEHGPVDDDARTGEVAGDGSLISVRLVEANVRAAGPDGLEILGVALGIVLAAASLVRRAVARTGPAWAAADAARRSAPLTALVSGVLGGLGVGAVPLGSALTTASSRLTFCRSTPLTAEEAVDAVHKFVR